MSEKEIFEKISEIIEDRFEIKADEITENLNFQDAENIHTVGDAVKYIYSHQG